jgi:hypothetical protein
MPIEAGGQTRLMVFGSGVARHRHEPEMTECGIRPHLSRNRKAVHDGHLEVDERQGRVLVMEVLERLEAISREQHPRAQIGQHLTQHFAPIRIVFDHEHGRGWGQTRLRGDRLRAGRAA